MLAAAGIAPASHAAAPTPETVTHAGDGARLVVDATGTATAVWPSSGGLHAATRAAGRRWGARTALPRPAGVSPARSAEIDYLELDRHDRVQVLWTAGRRSYSANKPPGGAWSTPEDVTGPDSGSRALGADGVIAAVWCHEVGPDSGALIQSAIRPPGGSWTAPSTLAIRRAADCDGAVRPTLKLDAVGNAAAVWLDQPAGPRPPTVAWAVAHQVVAAYRPAGGDWTTPVALGLSRREARPDLALDPAGRAYVVSGDEDEAPWLAVLDRTGLVVPPKTVPMRLGGARQLPYRPSGAVWNVSVSVDAGGTAVLIWSLGDIGESTPLTAARSRTGAWTPTTPLDPLMISPQLGYPTVQSDRAGNTLATWRGSRPFPDAGKSVYQAFRPSGGRWSTRTAANGGDGSTDPVAAARTSLLGPTLVSWQAGRPAWLKTVEVPAPGPAAVRLRLRTPRQTSRGVIRAGGIRLRCRLSVSGHCTVRLIPTRQTVRQINGIGTCIHGYAAETAPAARTTTVTLRLQDDYPPCVAAIRQLRRPGGPSLVFTATVIADAPGRTSTRLIRRVTIRR